MITNCGIDRNADRKSFNAGDRCRAAAIVPPAYDPDGSAQ
jgi:hypothetical protein